MKHFVLVILILFIFITGPLITIWSLNTLFELGVEYSAKTWAAALILGAGFYGPSAIKRKDKK